MTLYLHENEENTLAFLRDLCETFASAALTLLLLPLLFLFVIPEGRGPGRRSLPAGVELTCPLKTLPFEAGVLS
jgi:hypothetical protein